MVRNTVINGHIRHACMLILLLATARFASYAQNTDQRPSDNHERLFSEELLISTDRDLYAAGEKVWMKIYMLNSLTQSPDSISKVAYVDVLDLDNNPIIQLKAGMDGFSGSCNFTIPDTVRTGNYLIRAYTAWMQNFSVDLFASRTISVINPFGKFTGLKIPSESREADSILFYPEGGHLIEGYDSRLGLRALDRNGEPVKVTGAVVDEKNDTVSLVRTGINGYGISVLRPSGSRLWLSTGPRNRIRKFQLPVILKEGVSFTAPDEKNNREELARIRFSNDFPVDGNPVYLSVISSGLAEIRKEIRAEKNLVITVSGKDLPPGISHLLLTGSGGKVLTERWISNESNSTVNYRISCENPGTSRGKVKISISATDNNGKPLRSEFSVSVAKAVAVNRESISGGFGRQVPGMMPVAEDCNLTCLNDYLIFYKPHDPSTEIRTANGNPSPSYLPETEGHLVSGSIRDKVTGDPVRKCNITLSFVGRAALCLFTKTDDEGNFNFVTTDKGLREIVIQPLTPSRETYVDLKNPFASRFSAYDHGLLGIDTSQLDQINNLLIGMQIGNIYEPFYMKPPESSEVSLQNNFYGPPDNSILMSKYIELTSVREIVAELIPGVSTIRSGGKVSFRMTKPNQTKPYENPPLVLVDGVPVYDIDKVIGISSSEIEKVDVLVERYFISGNVLDGIIHFITKKGNLSVIDMNKSVFRMEYDLLTKKDNFYVPDYSQDSVKNNHLPDFRNTLYWNPDGHTDINGNAEVEFYSSDESGEYAITIEGITEDGLRGKATIPFIINR